MEAEAWTGWIKKKNREQVSFPVHSDSLHIPSMQSYRHQL